MEDVELLGVSQEIKRVDQLCSALANKKQLMNKVRAHLKMKNKPTKPEIVSPTYVEKFCHTRNVLKSTEKYLTTGRYCGHERDFAREPNPFHVPKEVDLFKNAFKFNRETRKRGTHEYASLNKTKDILPALRVESADEVVPKGKTEEDPEYFAVAQKRPIKEHFLRRKFARDHRKCFFRKLCVGFIQDEVKRKEEHILLDLWHMNNIREEFDSVIQTFEKYLADDHQESVKVIQQATEVTSLRERKLQELKRCRGYVNAIKCTLYKMEDQLSTRKYCKLALYKLSPSHWQTEFNAEVRHYRPVLQETVDKVMRNYESFCRYNPDAEKDHFLNEVIRTFVEDLLSLGPPRMYFEDKDEIDAVIHGYEHACLKLMKKIKGLKSKKREIEEERVASQQYYEAELAAVDMKIEQLKKGIRFEQESLSPEGKEEDQKHIVNAERIQEAVNLITLFYTEIIGGELVGLEDMMSLVEKRVIDVFNEAQNIFRLKYSKFRNDGATVEPEGSVRKIKHVSRENEIRSSTFLLKNVLTPPPYQQGWKGLIDIPFDSFERERMREEMASRREPDDEPDEAIEVGNLIRSIVAPSERMDFQPFAGDKSVDADSSTRDSFDPEEIYSLFERYLNSDEGTPVDALSSISFYPREEFTEMIEKAWAHPLSVEGGAKNKKNEPPNN